MPALRPYSRAEILGLEEAAFGFTLTAGPLEPYQPQLAHYRARPVAALAALAGESVVAGGIPVIVRRHLTRAGEWMLFLTLQADADLLEVVVMPDRYSEALPALVAGGPLVVRGRVEVSASGVVVLHGDKLRALRAVPAAIPAGVPAGASPAPVREPVAP